MIIPDLHSSPAAMAFALNLIQDDKVQYFGTEISQSGQTDFDDINKPNHPFSLLGYLKIIDHFWNFKREWNTNISSLDDQLKKIFTAASDMELIHAVTAVRSKPVIFMDAKLPYLDERDVCGIKLTHMTRNLIWANKIPDKGRVVALVGATHMAQPEAVNFQDFLKERFPHRKVFILQF